MITIVLPYLHLKTSEQLLLKPAEYGIFIFLKILFILDRGEGREKEGEKPMCGWLLCAPYWGLVLARYWGMCPNWESNQPPFSSQASTQSAEPHQSEWDI